MKTILRLIVLLFVSRAAAEQCTWTDYSNINDVMDVAVTESTLWCNTTGGLVRWNRTAGTWDKFMPTFGMQYSVEEVSIAPNGDVWISAFDELIRYDGTEMEIFTKEDVDVQGGIVAIDFEPDGSVWVGNRWGYASRYDGETWTELGEESGFGHRVYAIAVHPDNSVWFGTWGSGVFRYANGAVTQFSESEGLTDDRVLSLTVDKEGNVWVATAGGITMIHEDSLSTFPLGWTDTIGTGPDGAVWAAVADFSPDEPISHVYRFNGSSMEPFDIGADSVRVNRIVGDPVDGIWFCANKWLGHMTDDGWDHYVGASELFLNHITALDAASDGSVWFGHNRSPGAISRYLGDEWIIYPSGDAQRNDDVSCIHENRDGRIWFGPLLCSYYDGVWETYDDMKDMGRYEVRAFASAPDGSLWIGYNAFLCGAPVDTSVKSVWNYRNGSWSGYSMDDGVLSSTVSALTVDQANTVWVGTFDGICRFDGTKWENTTTSDELREVRYLATDPKGVVWACTVSGVYYYSNGMWEQFMASDADIGSYVCVIELDNNGGIWMGTTDSGLLYDDGTELHSFTTEDGLPNNLISSLDIASDGSLWVGTNYGVSRYIYQNDVLVEAAPVPSFNLYSNYPNPFNPVTTITYTIADEGHVTLSVYNLTGQKVATLVDSPKSAGTHRVEWDGSGHASGMYFYRGEINGQECGTGKMMLMK